MPEEPAKHVVSSPQEELGELVRRALVQAADLRDVEDKLKVLSDKASKVTPPPEIPPVEGPK